MIQLNLLPDVKLNYIKTKRTKRLALLGSFGVIAFSIGLLVLMLSVSFAQNKHLANLDKDISKYKTQLEQTENVTKILTVQNQLNNIDSLHTQKPPTSRLFPYITQLVPSAASVSQLDLVYADGTLNINGTADTLATVNKFVDTLKFTEYEAVKKAEDGTVQESLKAKAFSGVVLASFSKGEEQATYQINLKFDPMIFDSQYDVKLMVPNIISTRSNVEKPSALFQQPTEEDQ